MNRERKQQQSKKASPAAAEGSSSTPAARASPALYIINALPAFALFVLSAAVAPYDSSLAHFC